MKNLASRARLGAHPDWITGAALFLAAAALYVRTAAPTLGGAFDSEEFQHVAANLNIAHATGYPLYLLLGKAFTTLVPIGSVAYRMNLLSALLGAATVVVVYLNAVELTRRRIAAFATAALFATNPAVWRQAGVASVGPLDLLLVAGIFLAMLVWYRRHGSGAASAPTAAAFVFGLGLAHHRTTLLLAPAVAGLILIADSGILRRPRDLARCALWLVLPLLLCLYIPIFGAGTPWYDNSVQGFIAEISGGGAGEFLRTSPAEILKGVAAVSQYLLDSFGWLGVLLVAVGAATALPWRRRISCIRRDSRAMLFLVLATVPFAVWGALYSGEPDRYLVMPFAFLIYWFALGVGAVQDLLDRGATVLSAGRRPESAKQDSPPLVEPKRVRVPYLGYLIGAVVGAVVVVYLALPFADRFRSSDWGAFDRVYKQWEEIFTLPVPQGSVLVGNWGQLNAMRYMQRIEHRRPDLQFVGTLYDPTPQTDAARAAFADGRAIFLAPGIGLPVGEFRYGQLGPLLQVRDSPQMAPTEPARQSIIVNSELTLVAYQLTTGLEPYAPTSHIAPGRTVRAGLEWQTSGAGDFVVRLRLYDSETRLVAQTVEPPVRGIYPPSKWQAGEFVSDVHNLQIPVGTPPGEYQLRLQTLDASQKPTSQDIPIGDFQVDQSASATRDQVFIQHSLDVSLGQVDLWGYGGLDGTQRVGDVFIFYLVWHAHDDVNQDLTADFAFVDDRGEVLYGWEQSPILFYSTENWKQGEVLKAFYDTLLPDEMPPGAISLQVGMGERTATFGRIQVRPR